MTPVSSHNEFIGKKLRTVGRAKGVSTYIQAVKELISRLLVLQEQFKVLKNLKNEEQNV